MNLKKTLLMKLIILIITLILFNSGVTQMRKDGIISFHGYIDSIPEDVKFIVVNEIRVFISLNTKIVDEKGNISKIDDLKIRLPVAIEGIRRLEGIYADKITIIKTPKRKP